MATTRQNKGSETALATLLVAGTQKHFATVASLTFASASFTPAQVAAKLQELVTLRTDTDNARATLETKVAADTVQAPALLTFQRAYVQFVKTTFSNSPDILADFGLKAKKARTPLTVERKATAVAKNAATRSARGTKGAKQKLEVTGAVTGVVVTPVTAAKPGPAAAVTSGTSTPAGSPVASVTPAPPTHTS
jgi:hypothetical protein